jgi:DNA-binding response OmpR family regulator
VSQKPKCRVLIVEDDALISFLMEDMVSEFGSEVVGPALRINHALELARSAELNAAILDVNVDGEEIFSVADILEERQIPLIFATGYAARILPLRYQESQTVSKPFSYPALADALRTALEHQPCHTVGA